MAKYFKCCSCRFKRKLLWEFSWMRLQLLVSTSRPFLGVAATRILFVYWINIQRYSRRGLMRSMLNQLFIKCRCIRRFLCGQHSPVMQIQLVTIWWALMIWVHGLNNKVGFSALCRIICCVALLLPVLLMKLLQDVCIGAGVIGLWNAIPLSWVTSDRSVVKLS